MTDTATALPLLLTDGPEHPANDALGFQPHADRLAAMLLKQQFPEASFVVGIEGEWGEGKSTFINCLKQRFQQAEEKGETPPVVVEFNPWWFENPEKTASNLLEAIINGRNRNDKDAIKALEALLAALNHITPWLEKLASTPLVLAALFGANAVFATKNAPWLGALVAAGLALALYIGTKWLSRHRVWSESLAGLKQKAAAALTSEKMKGQKQIVIIDDLDRLSHEEIRQVFRAVKGVLDLPNIVYVIAYDRAIVASALDEVHKGRGEAYLEKIVQLPYRLPKPTPAAFNAYWLNGLGALPAFKNKLADSSADTAVCLQKLVDAFVQTPRDMKRLYANLLLNDSVAQQLGITAEDFAFLEAMRLKNGALWRAIAAIWMDPDGLRELRAGRDARKSIGPEGSVKSFPWGMGESELDWMKSKGIDLGELPSATKSALMYFFGWSARRNVEHRELAATELVSMWAALRTGNEQEMQRLARAWQSYLQYARDAGTDDS